MTQQYYNNCALIYPHFENYEMLELQVANWNRYAGELASSCRLVVVDDHSKDEKRVREIFSKCVWKNRALYRLNERLPWNQHQARNIGAKEVCTPEENYWLFLSDIDIVLTPEMAAQMLNRKLDAKHCYTMERTFAPEFTERKTHPNTFLMKHSVFWFVNGYDLDLTGGYGGGYGGDGAFSRQIFGIAPEKHLDDVVLVGYGRRSRDGQPALPDADTTSREYDRAEWSRKYQERFREKRNRGDMRSKNPIRARYTKVI